MTSSLQLQINGASLWAVPSVHFRLPFAEEVNWLCSTVKPDAVAVELGPVTASAAVAWLKDLGVGQGRGATLPCMLGLMKPNRRIRSSSRSISIRLQELTRKELHELSPDLLHDYLDYSAFTLLPLSSTDSIIEAMRCALELKVPLYGIDLEETAERRQRNVMLQDIASATGTVEDYVFRNEVFAEQQRDEEIDSRRELAIAARLKGLAQKHKRIVFAGGLAHWKRLRSLLADASLKPASYPSLVDSDLELFTRVILDPLLAVHHLDTFPDIASFYEDDRRIASPRKTAHRSERDCHHIFQNKLVETYCSYFIPGDASEQLDRDQEDWEALDTFERMLENLSILRQRRTPDIFTILASARNVMSEGFQRKLANAFMDIDWASPSDNPELPVLRPSPRSDERGPAPSAPNSTLRTELLDARGWCSQPFYVQTLPSRCSISMNIIDWEWPEGPHAPIPPATAGTETWVPTEDLINVFLFRAVRVARSQDSGPRVERFEGSLLDGVDLKSTLRSAARGEDQIFVRSDPRKQVRVSSSDEDADLDGFPVVWLFRLAEGTTQWEWKYSADALTDLRDELPSDWEDAGMPTDGVMLTSVAAVTDEQQDADLSRGDYVVTSNTIIGKLSYWPQCCKRRTAGWAIETKLKRNPVCQDAEIECLAQRYRQEYGIDIGNDPWHIKLIRMAIPFAKKGMTLVAPDRFTVPSSISQEVARRQVQLRVVPLSYFPADVLRRMSRVFWLPVLRREFDDSGIDYPVFPEHVTRHFSERMDSYRRLIAKKWH